MAKRDANSSSAASEGGGAAAASQAAPPRAKKAKKAKLSKEEKAARQASRAEKTRAARAEQIALLHSQIAQLVEEGGGGGGGGGRAPGTLDPATLSAFGGDLKDFANFKLGLSDAVRRLFHLDPCPKLWAGGSGHRVDTNYILYQYAISLCPPTSSDTNRDEYVAPCSPARTTPSELTPALTQVGRARLPDPRLARVGGPVLFQSGGPGARSLGVHL